MARKKDSSKSQWKVTVTYVPFESEMLRNQAYRRWVKLFLQGKKSELHIQSQESGKKKPF